MLASFPRRDLASSKEYRASRSTPALVNTSTWIPTSIGWPACARPPTPAYSPSEFSLTTTMSMSAGPRSRKGESTPGSSLTGRTFRYRSNCCRIGRRRPHSVMWSGTSGRPTAPR